MKKEKGITVLREIGIQYRIGAKQSYDEYIDK